MATPQQTALSLCSGIGGLDLAWSTVTGGRTVGYVEREAFPASILLERMEAEDLEPAPIWCGNFEDMDPTPFLGVDWVIAGLPCQPYSVAGKRLAGDDERAIWPKARKLIDAVGARFVFLENVPGFVRLGLPGVLGDLAEMGFDAEWCCVRAGEVGASHRRERLFVLAHRPQVGRGNGETERPWKPISGRRRNGVAYRNSAEHERDRVLGGMGEASSLGGQTDWSEQAKHAVGSHGEEVGHVSGSRGRRGPISDGGQGAQGSEANVGRPIAAFPPGPADREGWGEVLDQRPDLAPALTPVHRVVDGVPDWLDGAMGHRNERLRALGNSVVPLQGAYALRELLGRLEFGGSRITP